MATVETKLKEIKREIIAAILEQKQMDVAHYARSAEAKELFGKTADALPVFLSLSEKTSVSYPIMEALYSHLGLGALKREIKKITTVTYFTIKKDGKSSRPKAPRKPVK